MAKIEPVPLTSPVTTKFEWVLLPSLSMWITEESLKLRFPFTSKEAPWLIRICEFLSSKFKSAKLGTPEPEFVPVKLTFEFTMLCPFKALNETLVAFKVEAEISKLSM